MNITIESDQTLAIVEQFVPRQNAGGARGAAERERIRRAMDHAYFFGPDAEWLAAQIWARLDQAPESRLRRRNANIVALAGFHIGSTTAAAELISGHLCNYGASIWRRRDKDLKSAPLEYLEGTRQALLFSILKESGGEKGVPGVRQIRRILESHCSNDENIGHFSAIPMANESAHPLIGTKQRKDSAAMNAIAPHSDQKLLDVLKQSPDIQKIIADDHARTVSERQKIIAAMAALDARSERDFLALEKAVQIAIAGVREADKALRAANDRLGAASYAKSGANYAYTSERQRLEELLRDGVDSAMFDDFQRQMRDELDKTRKQFEGGSVRFVNRLTDRGEERGYNNGPSVNARLSAISAAMEEAERLRISADQSTVAARLAELRANLPKVVPAVTPAGDKQS
jgi:hypothetical protein